MNKFAIILISLAYFAAGAETVVFEENWSKNPLFSVTSETRGGVEVVFSMHSSEDITFQCSGAGSRIHFQ